MYVSVKNNWSNKEHGMDGISLISLGVQAWFEFWTQSKKIIVKLPIF